MSGRLTYKYRSSNATATSNTSNDHNGKDRVGNSTSSRHSAGGGVLFGFSWAQLCCCGLVLTASNSFTAMLLLHYSNSTSSTITHNVVASNARSSSSSGLLAKTTTTTAAEAAARAASTRHRRQGCESKSYEFVFDGSRVGGCASSSSSTS